MANSRKPAKLKAPQLFLLAALVGAVVALVILLAGNTSGTEIPRVDDPRLVLAATDGDLAGMRVLLAQDISANSASGDGSRALHFAAHYNNSEMTEVLLAAGADPDLTNDLGVSPLWLAAENANDAIAGMLLDAGADANLALPSGETPLMMAARSGNPNLIELLIQHGATVNAVENSQQQSALMWAAAQRHPEAVKALLKHGADINARSLSWVETVQPAGATAAIRDALYDIVQGGFTAYLFAAQQGNVEVAKHLLAAGVDVNEKAADGSSALVLATHSGHGELARFLLQEGADPNAMGAGYSALHIAIPHEDLALVQALIAHGADVNATVLSPTPFRRDSRDHAMRVQLVGTTPLWIAAQYRQTEILQALIDAGADTSFTTDSEDNIVMLAIDGREGFFKEQTRGIVDPAEQERRALQLIEYGLDLGIDINARNRGGDTALHKAAARGYDNIVRYLAEHGAELEAANKRGLTPLATAQRLRGRGVGQSATSNESTEDLLRRLGATL